MEAKPNIILPARGGCGRVRIEAETYISLVIFKNMIFYAYYTQKYWSWNTMTTKLNNI